MRRTNPDKNMDRYYSVQLTTGLFGDYGLERHWGRNGIWGQYRLDWFLSENEAEIAMSKLVKEKLTRGYVMKHGVHDNLSKYA
jgi:predicted DNA-binding WGR domain protein